IRFREASRVAICRAEYRKGSLAFFDASAAEFRILRGKARGVLGGTFVTKQFLDGRWNQGGVCAKLFELFRMAQKGQDSITNQIGGSFLAANHRDDAIGEDLFLTQTVSIDLCILQ